MWIIKNITDNGPSLYYRWHVSGENAFCEIPTEFHWNVPDLCDDRYFVHSEAPPSVVKMFNLARAKSVREQP